MSSRRPAGSRIAAATATLAIALSLPAAGVARPSATPASYPSCGSYWNRNNPVTATQRRVNACIAKAARDGRRARAIAVYTTMEGDPIVHYVFVRGPRDVLVVADGTRDRFGSGKWTRERCTKLTASGGFLGCTGCRTLGTGKPSWLVPYRLPR